MRFFVKLLIVTAIIVGAGWAAYTPAMRYWRERNRPSFRTEEVTRRTITSVVNSTGEVKPVLSVLVGSFVSGPIEELHADFNDRVEKGQLLAEIDPRIYEASVQRDRATLITRQADVERVRAELQQAINNENRSIALREENADFISKTEMDRFHFSRVALEAQLKVAEATIDQAEANLNNSEANLGYTKIRSPVDGIIIDRKIDPGQTLAAQFQAPELFIIAPEMDKKMHIFASVDEADIGLIRSAQEKNNPVEFTVDAYPDDLFVGEIEQIRFSSTETQSVVTYPVVVAAANGPAVEGGDFFVQVAIGCHPQHAALHVGHPDIAFAVELQPGGDAVVLHEIARGAVGLHLEHAAIARGDHEDAARAIDQRPLGALDVLDDAGKSVGHGGPPYPRSGRSL